MDFVIRGIAKFLFVLLVMSLSFCIAAQEEKSTVRVGISNQSFSLYEYTKASFSSPDEILISDMASNNQFKVPANTIITAQTNDSGFSVIANDKTLFENAAGSIVIAPKEKLAIEGLNRKGTPAYYGGLTELVPTKNNKFNIVNVLDVQTYLKGVVPNEMPVSFGLEAIKAQAVAARNYVNRPQNAYKNYDICDSTACQVYYGLNSHTDVSNRAVDETKGIFALYNSEPILALYSSTAGGITEDWKNVYGYNQPLVQGKPYLVSVTDDKSQKFLTTEKDVRDFYSNKALSYDIKSPRYRWNVEWTREELEDILNKTLVEQSRGGLVEPKFDGSFKLEELKDIKVVTRGNSGKALEIEIVFKNGTYRIKRELGIRRVLKKNNAMLPSANFFVDKVEGKYEPESDDDSKETQKQDIIFAFEKLLTPSKIAGNVPDKFIITGGGFGHGVGMSQYGAGYMAQNGKKYDEILKHYYTSIKLGTMKKEVLYNPYDIEYKTGFYYSKTAGAGKKCILKVNNPKHVSSLNFMVNSYTFTPDMRGYTAQNLGMDITKYLREGNNTVVFKPLEPKDRAKSVTFQIEMGN